eukprot:2050830-Pyramimonas_sp.AAC.1
MFEKGSLAEQSKFRKTVMRYFNEVLRTSVGHNKHVKQRSKSMDVGSLTLVTLSSGQEGESGPDQVSDSDMEITTGSDRVNLARQLAVPVEPPAMLSTSTSASVPTRAILDETRGQSSQARDNSLYVLDSQVQPSHCGKKETVSLQQGAGAYSSDATYVPDSPGAWRRSGKKETSAEIAAWTGSTSEIFNVSTWQGMPHNSFYQAWMSFKMP